MWPIESRPDSNDVRSGAPADPPRVGEMGADWRWLYRIGGLSAALLVVVTIIHSGVYFVVGLPDDVIGWIGLALSLGSVLCLTGFNVLIAWRLLHLGRAVPAEQGGAWPVGELPLAVTR